MNELNTESESRPEGLAIKLAAALFILLALLVTAFAFSVKFLSEDLKAAGVMVEPSAVFSYTMPMVYMGLGALALILGAALPPLILKGRTARPYVYSLTLSFGFVLGAAFGLFSARHLVRKELAGGILAISSRQYAELAFSNMLKTGILFLIIGGLAGMYINAPKEGRKPLGIALLLACVLLILMYIFYLGPSGTQGIR